MSAAFVRSRELAHPEPESSRFARLIIGGRYFPIQKVAVFLSDFLWLLLSGWAALSRSATHAGPAYLIELALSLAVIYQVSFYLMDLYDRDERAAPYEFGLNLLLACGLVAVVVAAGEKFGLFPRALPLVPQLTFTAVFVVTSRALLAQGFSRRRLRRVGFIGGPDARDQLAKHARALEVIGIKLEAIAERFPQIMGSFASAPPLQGLRSVVVEDDRLSTAGAQAFLERCARAGIEVICLSTFSERALGRVSLGSHLLRDLAFPATGWVKGLSDVARRVRDILLGAIALLISLPVWVLIAIAIKLDSRGPVFFTQERVGRDGQRFTMFKFRSMRSDIKVLRGPQWTTHEADPRITRVGAVIRLLHLDELPQLINVIRGEMSIVGPRPFHPLHSAQLESSPYFKLRLAVPPGITGWAQIRCDYSDSVSSHEEVLARDLFYLKHAGLLFDLLVIFDTIRVCIWRRGSR